MQFQHPSALKPIFPTFFLTNNSTKLFHGWVLLRETTGPSRLQKSQNIIGVRQLLIGDQHTWPQQRKRVVRMYNGWLVLGADANHRQNKQKNPSIYIYMSHVLYNIMLGQ